MLIQLAQRLLNSGAEADARPSAAPGLLKGGKAEIFIRGISSWNGSSPKLHLIKYCMDNSIPLVSSMGAGAKFDATKVRIADVSKSFNCPLAYIVRKRLRHMGIRNGFKVVFSEELPDKDSIVPCEDRNKKSQVGTISYIPAVFGCACAQAVIQGLMSKR